MKRRIEEVNLSNIELAAVLVVTTTIILSIIYNFASDAGILTNS